MVMKDTPLRVHEWKSKLWQEASRLVTELNPKLDTIDTLCAIARIYQVMLDVMEMPR